MISAKAIRLGIAKYKPRGLGFKIRYSMIPKGTARSITPASIGASLQRGMTSPASFGRMPSNHIQVNTAMKIGIEMSMNQKIRLKCTIGIDKLSIRIIGGITSAVRNCAKILFLSYSMAA